MQSNLAQKLTIDNTEIAYWTYGAFEHPPIVMIHGFRGTHDGLELIARNLSENYFVIVPDLPGFGDSQAFSDQPHSLENYSRFVGKFIEALELESKPVLLGHSFGSIVVSHLAAKNSHVISKLILINPIGAPALEGPKAILSRLALFYYNVGEILPARLARQWLAARPVTKLMGRVMAKSNDATTLKFIDEQHYQHFSRFKNPSVVSQAFHASISHNVSQFARDIPTPTLIIAGQKDDLTPIEKQRELVKLFPKAELKEIENAGHLIHYETPIEASDLIKKFID